MSWRRHIPAAQLPSGCVLEPRQHFRGRYFRVRCEDCGWDFPYCESDVDAVTRFKGHECRGGDR